MGPNGAGKSTLLQLAAARLHPTAGDVGVLDEVLGAVDVFELRPRIGLSSAQLAAQVPANETVQDAVVTAAYGITGTWRERYETEDRARALGLVATWGSPASRTARSAPSPTVSASACSSPVP